MSLFQIDKKSTKSLLDSVKLEQYPFSILDTTKENWQARKGAWESLGIESTDGRDVSRKNATPTNVYSVHGKTYTKPNSISTFDPVLAELMITWFSNEGDIILDPFAGGSVRGIVSGVLNREYYGIDISPEQIRANRKQVEIVSKHIDIRDYVYYDVSDAESSLDREIKFGYTSANMLFTCPPYYNLEKYTDFPEDLSNAPTYHSFLYKYRKILEKSIRLLHNGSFIVIVVSEIRNFETGEYYGFVKDTIDIFQRCENVHYYNEMILKNSVGSLPIRSKRFFNDSRKIGRHHQNVLVFYKGDPKKIGEKFSPLL